MNDNAEQLHLVFTDFPGPDGRCQFVEMESADGRGVSVGEWRQRQDGYVELVLPSPSDLKVAISHELYRAMKKLGAEPELLDIVGSYGDTLEDKDVLADLKRYNDTGSSL